MITAWRKPMPGACTKPILALFVWAVLTVAGATAVAAQDQGQFKAQPRCGLVIETGPDQWIIEYDPLTATAATRQFDLAVVNRGEGPCTGVVEVDLRGEPFGLALAGDPTRLPYILVNEDSSSDLTPRTGENQRRIESKPINLQPGARKLLRFSLSISAAEILSAGLYSQTAYIRVNHPGGSAWAERPVTLGVRVASAALMGLKGEFTRVGGVPTIDLGVLNDGDRSLNTSLYVLSTSSYAVSVSSANGGRLRQGDSGWNVPYTLQVGTHAVDLSRPTRLDVVSTRSRVDDYPLSVSIGSVVGRRAGSYSDVVTFTIAAL